MRWPTIGPVVLSLAFAAGVATDVSCAKVAARASHPAVGCRAAAGPMGAAPAPTGLAWSAFHGDRGRTGWNPAETSLTPAKVGGAAFGPTWSSSRLDEVEIDRRVFSPHVYASPLYLDGVEVSGNGCDGLAVSAVFAASSNGFAYAVNAFDVGDATRFVPAGTILWSTSLGTPSLVEKLDGGMPLGVLSTPVLDATQTPPRLYVVSLDATRGWRAHALELGTGRELPGWPVTIDDAAVSRVNTNGPARFADALVLSQRGALNLSPKGDRLYVPFGGYFDGGVGWMVVLDTTQPGVVVSFSGAPSSEPTASGGIWGAGGPAIDEDGRIYATTGNSPHGSASAPHVWGNSLLAWTPPLRLDGTYTPFNYCALDVNDADLGGGSPMILPPIDAAMTTTPKLLAFGGKQGNVYLLDRARLAVGRDARPPCSDNSASDNSLLGPEPQAHFGARGPLNVFGPYSEDHQDRDYAKMRSKLALFADARNTFLFVSGTTKEAVGSTQSVPPSLLRLRVVLAPGAPASLAIDGKNLSAAFLNPGSPVVSSHGPDDAIVWVLDSAPRTASLQDPDTRRPVLYAMDAKTMGTLWQSADLEMGGKYSTAVVAHGTVVVGTDRLRAFGMR